MAILGQAEDAGQPGSMKLSSGGRRSKIFELEADICDALSSCRQRKFGNRIRFLRENRDHPEEREAFDATIHKLTAKLLKDKAELQDSEGLPDEES